MRLFKSLVLLIFISCNSKNRIDLNFSKIINDKNSIIISCLKCNCIIDELNNVYRKDSALLSKYDIFIDKDCSNGLLSGIKTKFIEQKSLDSISTDIYNLLILKKTSTGIFKTRLVKNNDSKKLYDYLK